MRKTPNANGKKTIVLAFDSFKGSLTSDEVAEAFGEGLHEAMPNCTIRKACIADGGEGTAEALVRTLNGEWVEARVSDPLGRPITARYGIIDHGETAVIEMAEASGLTLLREGERNPMKTTTYGTGELMAHAIRRGCRKLLIGIGGSATNDGGTGLLRALGFGFLDKEGKELDGGGEILGSIARIDSSQVTEDVWNTQFIVVCDVTNPLYGPEGAAHVFAPQKGADEEMVKALDAGLQNYAKVIKKHNGKDISLFPGAGAAGGCGAGLTGLLGARLERGIDMLLDAIHFEETLRGCDLVVTGEGCIDHQTVMGKAPSGVLRAASAQGIPTIAIGGRIAWCKELRESAFADIICINDNSTSTEDAMMHDIAMANVKRIGKHCGEKIVTGNR